jgi:hypothetical protein
MMKFKKVLVLVVLICLVLLAMVPGSVMARAVRTEFTGIEVPAGPPDFGEWKTLPSGNVHVRGMTTVYLEQVTDPRMAGLNTVVMNANWGPDYTGPMWGTNESVIDSSAECLGGGTWRGTWTGTMNGDGSYSYDAVGHGVSGCVEGLHFWLTGENPGGDSFTTIVGMILDPHGG